MKKYSDRGVNYKLCWQKSYNIDTCGQCYKTFFSVIYVNMVMLHDDFDRYNTHSGVIVPKKIYNKSYIGWTYYGRN